MPPCRKRKGACDIAHSCFPDHWEQCVAEKLRSPGGSTGSRFWIGPSFEGRWPGLVGSGFCAGTLPARLCARGAGAVQARLQALLGHADLGKSTVYASEKQQQPEGQRTLSVASVSFCLVWAANRLAAVILALGAPARLLRGYFPAAKAKGSARCQTTNLGAHETGCQLRLRRQLLCCVQMREIPSPGQGCLLCLQGCAGTRPRGPESPRSV